MTEITVFAVSLIVGLIFGKLFIPVLKRLKASQTEREVLKSHLAKAGTPTMGGIIILVALVAGCIWTVPKFPLIVPVLVLTVGFGIIGFVDDFLKVVLRRSDGLLAWQKMLFQIAVTTVFVVYVIYYSPITLALRIPFTHGYMLDIGWVAIPLVYFAVIGTVNGTNFTDGLDGLATTVTVIVAIFFTMAARLLSVAIEPVGMAMLGALIAFLFYNQHPAKVFMGDTGSLALGGFVAGMAYMLNMPLYILIIGIIYVAEVLSVILQVGSFKLRHGKRIFRMAPIHHHFELGGWSEKKVVSVFAAVTAAALIIAMLGI